MTGFCKTELSFQDLNCNVEIRSVNHRFLEAKIHLPRQFQYFEETLKKELKKKINRGKVDVYLQLDSQGVVAEKLAVNLQVWENVQSIVAVLEKDVGRNLGLNMSDLLQIKGLMGYEQDEKNHEDYEKLFIQSIQKGADELIKMRQREGELLMKDILGHVDALQKLVLGVPELRSEVVGAYTERMNKNLEKLTLKYDAEDPRIMQEVGIFMDRSDITEEIERFNSHLSQMRELLASDEPVGRKLDFIMQELNREANTLCSKANHIQVTQIGVDLKCEIEKVREQIQNIE